MYPFDQSRCIQEIKFQCRLAIRAMGDYKGCYEIWQSQPRCENGWLFAHVGPPGEERDRITWAAYDTFRHIHSFLAHFGNISKLFWPIGTQKKNESEAQFETRLPRIKRGRELRELYSIKEIDVINDRDLRDDFEHFDERMDSYFEQYTGSIIDYVIGCEDILSETDRNSILRHATDNIFSFRGVDFDLKLLIDTVTQILARSIDIENDI